MASAERRADAGDWQQPGPNDIRGPCPGLNALANHGFLPRDGKNIHITDIVTAMNDHLGIAVGPFFLFTLISGRAQQ